MAQTYLWSVSEYKWQVLAPQYTGYLVSSARVYLGRGGGSAQVPGLPDTCPSFSQLVSVSPHCTRDTALL